jgi:Tol biopolymer transport system component
VNKSNGFVLSPDGTKIAFSDGRGVWLSEVPQGAPSLIAEHQHRNSFCGVWRARNWSPDGKHLLIDVGCYEGGYSAVMDVDTGEVFGDSTHVELSRSLR